MCGHALQRVKCLKTCAIKRVFHSDSVLWLRLVDSYLTSHVSNLFLEHDFFFFFRLLVCKTFLVMTMFLLHVDLKNSVMPKMTLSWITVVRHSLTIFVTLKWRIRIVTCCE